MRPCNLSIEELNKIINDDFAKWLTNLEKHIPSYLTGEYLPMFYEQYRARILKTKKSVPLSYERYLGHSREYIKRYTELRRKAIEAIRSKILPPLEEEERDQEESTGYYLIYSEIIDLAEKGWPIPVVQSAVAQRTKRTLQGTSDRLPVTQRTQRGYYKAMHAPR